MELRLYLIESDWLVVAFDDEQAAGEVVNMFYVDDPSELEVELFSEEEIVHLEFDIAFDIPNELKPFGRRVIARARDITQALGYGRVKAYLV